MRRAGFVCWLKSRCVIALAVVFTSSALPGCSEPSSPDSIAKPSFQGIKLTVGALGHAAILEGLAAQRGEWVASRQGELSIRPEPLASVENISAIDLLIFPAQALGDLVDAGALEMIPNEAVDPPSNRSEADTAGRRARTGPMEPPADLFQYRDIAPVFRDQVTRYGSDRLALPLGGTALVLVYRRDAFSNPSNQQAARAMGLTLEPPPTWSRLDALVRFFQNRDWNGDGKPDYGIAAVLGSDSEGIGNATFLARAASLGQHRDQYSFLFDSDSMNPRIDSPPFVEALRGILSWKDGGPQGIEKFDGPTAREAFRTGKVAFLIDLAERAASWSGGAPVGVVPLPGSERVYEPLRRQWETPASPNAPSYLPLGGGWLVGVRSGLAGTQRAAALDLAIYLSSPENVNRLRAERSFPMLPVRSAVMGQGLPDPTSAPDVDARQWSDAVSRTLLAERVVPGLRIPEAAGYLNELSSARVSALGGKDPGTALRELAKLWDARAKARGQGRQLWHYRRSLNTLSTLPEPPPR
jgi:multiple sugar transport system substrate-binding protein